MSEALNRAVEALSDNAIWDTDNITNDDYANIIRAILKAIREPTEAMVDAGYRYSILDHAEAWRGMIDEVLK